ncbi:septum formation family protein [Streptomyces sp. 900105755]
MSIPPPPGPHQPQGPYPPPQSGLPQYPQYPQAPYGQQSPYPGPYQQWGQGYGPYAPQPPVNGLAIASLVLGVLCCLPGAGLVLGLAGLGQIRKRGERGRAMAVVGSVFSVLGLALWVVALSTGGAAEFWQGVKEGANDSSSVSLSTGDCFDTPDGTLTGDLVSDVTVVDCEKAHDGEVFATYELKGSDYPGDESVGDSADRRCYAMEDGYAMDGWAVPGDVDVYYFTPSADSWEYGDREVACVFGNTTEGRTLSGSLRNDESMLDADQVAYLDAAHVLNTALAGAPEAEYVEDDLPGYRQWAQQVTTALSRQTAMLRAHGWDPDAKKPVDDLVADLDRAKAEWAKAAKATDADTYYSHYDKGSALLDPKRTVTARKALGLATTPPSYDDGGGGAGSGGSGSGVEV